MRSRLYSAPLRTPSAFNCPFRSERERVHRHERRRHSAGAMAKINPQLLAAIMDRTGLSRAQVYTRIKQTASAEFLPRHLAAIRVGAEAGVTINKYARGDELGQLRSAGSPVAPPPGAPASATPGRGRAETKQRTAKQGGRATPNSVFVVHGRDNAARNAMFTFLRAVGVKPIEWTSAVGMSKKAAPYIGEVLDAAFARARAIVVLMTPDDLAQLRSDLLLPSDKPYERILTGQARPNVLFEAGMAFATHPDRTVMVQLGNVREFSDVAGRHIVHMSNEYARRQELATKLKNAGCDVDTTGSDWVEAGDFVDPQARVPSGPARRRRLTRR